MLFQTWLARTLLAASAVAARQVPVPRPIVSPSPLDSWKPMPCSPARDPSKVCVVEPGCGCNADDAPGILAALQECNNGGTIVFDRTYNIASPLDLTFLNAVDVVISGSINFSNNLTYWLEDGSQFILAYRNLSTWWQWGGTDVNIYGGGVINGNGQAWWDELVVNSSISRPLLFVVNNMHGGSISNLKMVNAPDFYNLVSQSSDLIYSDLFFDTHTDDASPFKNTDGWDTFRSDNIVIQSSVINNGDDCVAFKANSTNIIVQGLQCNGSHGISVGSLGEEKLEIDIVENIYVYNVTLSQGTSGAAIRFKADSNIPPTDPSYTDGGGPGYIRNVTYDTFHVVNDPYSIEITQCYNSKNETYCNDYPSKISISDVLIKNVWGTTQAASGQVAGTFICNSQCENIRVQNISVQPIDGRQPVWYCAGLEESLLEVPCTNYTSSVTPDM